MKRVIITLIAGLALNLQADTNSVAQARIQTLNAEISQRIRSARNTPELQELRESIEKQRKVVEDAENALPGMADAQSQLTAARAELRRYQQQRNIILRVHAAQLAEKRTALEALEHEYMEAAQGGAAVRQLLRERNALWREMERTDE